MHLIDSATAQNGKFVSGNATTGVKATQFTPDWCNAVQEEIANAVKVLSPLNKGRNDQLATVIKNLISVKYTSVGAKAALITIAAGSSDSINSGTVQLIASNIYDITVSFSVESDDVINLTVGLLDSNYTAAAHYVYLQSGSHHVTIRMIGHGDKSGGNPLNATINVTNKGSAAVTIHTVNVDVLAMDHV